MKALFSRLRVRLLPLSAPKGIAVLFLAFVLVLATVKLPQSIEVSGKLLQGQLPATQAITQMDDAYFDMLPLEGVFPRDKRDYIAFNGLMAGLMGQRKVNERVKLNNGHLHMLDRKLDVSRQASQVTELYRRLAAQGKTLLFVMVPGQLCKYEQLLPVGYEDYGNENADEMLAKLQAAGVPTMDFREVMHQAGISHTDAYFATDHHWKPETAFWAYGQILARLERDGWIPPVDPLYTNIKNYQVEVRKGTFLGYSGRRVGPYYAGMEDFSFITPTFDTWLTYEDPQKKERLEGPFAQTVFDAVEFNAQNMYLQNYYAAYAHGNPDVGIYKNQRAPIHSKMLWLGDSLGNAVVPFMALTFEQLYDVDTRFSDITVSPFLDDLQPDITVFLIYVETLQDKKAFHFFPDPTPQP